MGKRMIATRAGSKMSKIVEIFVNMILYSLYWLQYVGFVPLKVSETLSAELYSCVVPMFLSVGGENNAKLFFFFFFSFLRLKIISGSKCVFSLIALAGWSTENYGLSTIRVQKPPHVLFVLYKK